MANHLLLIAIGDYKYWRPLRGPSRDADALQAVLFDRYGFCPQRTIDLRDSQASSVNILTAFRQFKDAPPDDQLLIYYAGHGCTDEFDRTGFWIPHDAETDSLQRVRWIPNTSIRGALTTLSFRHILLICDSCFSGDLLDEQRDLGVSNTAGYIENAVRKRSREVLTSGASEPVSDADLGGHSAFAFHLVDTLRTSRDSWLDPMRLYDHIRSGVRGQSPLYGWLNGAGHQRGGSFVLLREKATIPVPLACGPLAPIGSISRKEVCPICGIRNYPDETFRCVKCGRDYLCMDHFVRNWRCCEDCSERDVANERARAIESATQSELNMRLCMVLRQRAVSLTSELARRQSEYSRLYSVVSQRLAKRAIGAQGRSNEKPRDLAHPHRTTHDAELRRMDAEGWIDDDLDDRDR